MVRHDRRYPQNPEPWQQPSTACEWARGYHRRRPVLPNNLASTTYSERRFSMDGFLVVMSDNILRAFVPF